jgi:hypothetical protein
VAINFSNLKGKAEKGSFDRFKPAIGINRFRMIGGILPMYSYWVKLADESGSVPMECLSFNRDEERFDNKDTDIIKDNDKNARCSWSYKGLVLDREDGKIKVFDHKKKLLASIIKYAEKKLGDPTNADSGWDIVFEKVKTGPLPFNIEYTLEHADLESTPLTQAEKDLIAEHDSIETFFKRPSAEDQAKFFNDKILGDNSEDVPAEMNDDIG